MVLLVYFSLIKNVEIDYFKTVQTFEMIKGLNLFGVVFIFRLSSVKV